MLQIRRYRAEDNRAVRELHVLALVAVGGYIGSGYWDSDLDYIEEAYLTGGDFLVGTIDEQIVAMGALKPVNSTRGEIKRMRVHPDFQKRGFGQIILSRLEKRAQELGYQVLQLDTMVIQKAAQRLYKRNGYQEYKRELLGGHESIFYEKVLAKKE